MNSIKIINPKAHKDWLIERIRCLEETDSPVLASVANACLHYLVTEIGHSNLCDPITGAPLLKTAGYLKELEMYIHRLQRLQNTEPCVKVVHDCISHLEKQAEVNQTVDPPSCPYCGNATTPITRLKATIPGVGKRWQCYFRCNNCSSTSPVVITDCETEGEAISAAKGVAQRRSVFAEEVVSRDNHETVKADRGSWKDAFSESNEKIAEEIRRKEEAERENKRLRTIIVQHFPGDKVCSLCKHFDQCKQEALEENDVATQAESLFWSCDGYQHFDIDMDKVPEEGV